MTTKRIPDSKRNASDNQDMQEEYRFDYSKAKPNRFAGRARQGSVAILLDPDVADVFKDSDAVNAVLRALLATMPPRSAKRSRRA